MFVVQITFTRSSSGSEQDQYYQLSSLLGSWARSGNLTGDLTSARQRDGWIVHGLAPAKDAFARANWSDHSRKAARSLKQLGVRGPNIRILGPSAETEVGCECPKRPGYILFTHFLSHASPIRCLRCWGTVPLYQLPFPQGGRAEGTVHSWESDYKACDTLQIGCQVGERFGTRQLEDWKSSLTRSGLEVCKEIAALAKRPTYYYLCKCEGRSLALEEARRCPGCGGVWRRKKPLHGLFDFKCDKCHVLSNIGFNYR